MSKIKVVLIGIGHDHAWPVYDSVLKQKDCFEVVGFAIPECEESRFSGSISRYLGVIPKMTVEEALNTKGLDAAIIETEEENLTKYAIMALRKGLNVHMDKPGSASLEQFCEMVKLAKEKKKALHLGYMYRYNPVLMKLFEDVKNGEFGDIYSVEAQMSCYHTAEKRAWMSKFPGGMMFYLGCHMIDLVYKLQGEPHEIIPLNSKSGIDGVDAFDFGMVAYKYKNGVSFVKTCAAEPGGFMRRQLVICGSKKTAVLCPIEVLDEGGLQHTDYSIVSAEDSVSKGWFFDAGIISSEKFNRYDDMMRNFSDVASGEKQNEYSYDYELNLFRMLIKSVS